MKKIYEAPKAEKLEFDYTDTIVAASGCVTTYTKDNQQGDNCTS